MKEIIGLTVDILKEIDTMTEHLYQEKEDGIAFLNKVIGKIESLLGNIAVYQSAAGVKIVDEPILLGAIGNAFQALQNNDSVLLADIFHYEVREQLIIMIGK